MSALLGMKVLGIIVLVLYMTPSMLEAYNRAYNFSKAKRSLLLLHDDDFNGIKYTDNNVSFDIANTKNDEKSKSCRYSERTWLITLYRYDLNTSALASNSSQLSSAPFCSWVDRQGNTLLRLAIHDDILIVDSFYSNSSSVPLQFNTTSTILKPKVLLDSDSSDDNNDYNNLYSSESRLNHKALSKYANLLRPNNYFWTFSAAVNITSEGFQIYFDDELRLNHTHRFNWDDVRMILSSPDIYLVSVPLNSIKMPTQTLSALYYPVKILAFIIPSLQKTFYEYDQKLSTYIDSIGIKRLLSSRADVIAFFFMFFIPVLVYLVRAAFSRCYRFISGFNTRMYLGRNYYHDNIETTTYVIDFIRNVYLVVSSLIFALFVFDMLTFWIRLIDLNAIFIFPIERAFGSLSLSGRSYFHGLLMLVYNNIIYAFDYVSTMSVWTIFIVNVLSYLMRCFTFISTPCFLHMAFHAIADSLLILFLNPDLGGDYKLENKLPLSKIVFASNKLPSWKALDWVEMKCLLEISLWYLLAGIYCNIHGVNWAWYNVLWVAGCVQGVGFVLGCIVYFFGGIMKALKVFRGGNHVMIPVKYLTWRIVKFLYVSYVAFFCSNKEFEFDAALSLFIMPFHHVYTGVIAGAAIWLKRITSLSAREITFAISLVVIFLSHLIYKKKYLNSISNQSVNRDRNRNNSSSIARSSSNISGSGGSSSISRIFKYETAKENTIHDKLVKAAYEGRLDDIRDMYEHTRFVMNAPHSSVENNGGISSNGVALDGDTCLTAACKGGCVDVVRYLLSNEIDEDHLIDVNYVNSLAKEQDKSTTPLIIACKDASKVEIVRLLLESDRVNVAFEDRFGMTALKCLEQWPQDLKLFEIQALLLGRLAEVAGPEDAGSSLSAALERFKGQECSLYCGDPAIIQCPKNHDHKYCINCFNNMVKSETNFTNENYYIKCGCHFICMLCRDLPKGEFPRSCIRLLDKDAISMYECVREEYVKVLDRNFKLVIKQTHDRIMEKLKFEHDLVKEKTKKTELVINHHTRCIQEDVLATKCPHCGLYYGEWAACFRVQHAPVPDDAKQLTSYGCQKFFCGWCLKKFDNGGECQSHVSVCPLSLNPGSAFSKNGYKDGLKARQKMQETAVAKYLNHEKLCYSDALLVLDNLGKGKVNDLDYHYLAKDSIIGQLKL